MQATRKLWARTTLFALLGVVSALISIGAQWIYPGKIPFKIGADSVDGILGILASSMLSVTTFSLSVMIAAYSSVTTNVTPRATKLLIQDSTTQNALATFIGSFLYSLVGIIALSTGAYGDGGRLVLFLVTLLVIGLIVFTLLRWIDHLSRFGRVGETTDRVEAAATRAIEDRLENPFLGGHPLRDPQKDIPKDAVPVYSEQIGYIQYIDMQALQTYAEQSAGDVFVTCLPGTFVFPSRPLLWVKQPEDKRRLKALETAFTVNDERTFEQDPRFGLVVLAEIGSRALSAATNDSGTAIDMIGRGVRLLSRWSEKKDSPGMQPEHFPNVWVPPLLTEELFDDLFLSFARDSAGTLEVQIRLQKGFLALTQLGDERVRENAVRHSQLALKRTELALTLEEDKAILRELAKRVEEAATAILMNAPVSSK
ncbi:DUF2254 domain-containing protein [Planctomicrobium sp. SH668]|uniref:DUF2254 domain-containing protein n=1 Tax=Planctomicrobium sp. SH668 TaxID=3448126 RepID=UPI003F5C7E2C